MTAIAFYDAQCPRCGRRFGWNGVSAAADVPVACPACGHRISEPLVGPDRDEIARFRQFLRDRKRAAADPPES